MQCNAIILGSFPGVRYDCIGLVYECGIAVIASEVRMLLELMHESSVAGLDYRLWRIRLNVQDSVVVSFVLHGPNKPC